MKQKTIADLNSCYTEADEVDKALFSEQRSNILLASGDHYTKRHSRYWAQIREQTQLNEETKLRITKNHIHRICNIYANNIYSLAPDVAILPHNEKELRDQKMAEMYTKLWSHWKQEVRLREQTRKYADDFTKIGEVGVKIFWNPMGGKFLGYEQATDEETGQPLFDEMGQPSPSDIPVFKGALEIERLMAFNVLRDPNSKEIYDGYLIVRKMVDTKSLEAQYAGDEEKLKFVSGAGSSGEFTVFEGNSGNYYRTKEQVLVREHYYPVSEEYPNGYFYICTDKGILEEGELPFGIMPVIMEGFDEIPTSPRKRSIIKQLRPVQGELNRAASQAAMHQITLGDDKLITMPGTKVTQASRLPGIRNVQVSGAPPTILPGRTGDQFTDYIVLQQKELYEIANLPEEMQEKSVAQTDPYVELFKSMRHKKKYTLYAEKMEHFLTRVCETVCFLLPNYLSDEDLVAVLGPQEQPNISEFRRGIPNNVTIKLSPQSEDIETKMGRHIELMQAVQYMGTKLEKDDLGKILRASPFANKEEIFSDLTLDYDSMTNLILALDRGEVPELNTSVDPTYAIKRLEHRIGQPDFKYLHPQIQEAYQLMKQGYVEVKVQQAQALKAAQAEFIPSGGYLVGCDFYVTDPENPSRTRRARIPYDALSWLVKQLESQGSTLQDLERLQTSAQADLASQFISQMAQGQMPQVPQMQQYAAPVNRPIAG